MVDLNFAISHPRVVTALKGTDVSHPIGKKESFVGEWVLGLFWQSSSDCFGFELRLHNIDEAVINGERRLTKRELLIVAMSIFDPLGFLSNFATGAKLLMRELWKYDLHWNDPLSNDVNVVWEKWRKQLPGVVKYIIPHYTFNTSVSNWRWLPTKHNVADEATRTNDCINFSPTAHWSCGSPFLG